MTDDVTTHQCFVVYSCKFKFQSFRNLSQHSPKSLQSNETVVKKTNNFLIKGNKIKARDFLRGKPSGTMLLPCYYSLLSIGMSNTLNQHPLGSAVCIATSIQNF